jgi:hypothetical protein
VNPWYPAVAARAFQRCEYCHAPEVVFNFAFEVEHIQPQSQGGQDTDDNLALACSACNLFKSDAVVGRDEETQSFVPLFHPRTDRWEEHFRVDETTAEIVGLTPVGRATVGRLQMNRSRQVAARRQWIRLGIFP